MKIFVKETRIKLLALENMQGTKEIEVVLTLLRKYPKDAYLSIACGLNGKNCLNSGEPLVKVFELIRKIDCKRYIYRLKS